jgi:O-antigen/teichoic acid export membrane protein
MSFLIVPILTRAMTPAEYGVIGLYSIFQMFVVRAFSLGTPAAISREYYVVGEDNLRKSTSTALLFYFAAGLLITVLIAPIRHWLTAKTGVSGFWLLMLGAFATLNWITSTSDIIIRAKSWSAIYAAINVIAPIIDAVISCVLVVFFHLSFNGRFIGALAELVFRAIASLGVLRYAGLLGRSFDLRMLMALVAIGSPLIVYSLGDWGIAQASGLILSALRPMGALGVLTVAITISGAVAILQQGLSQALTPWIMSQLKDGTAPALRRIGTVTVIVDVAGGIAVFAIYVALRILFPLLVGPKFSHVLTVLPWILTARYCSLIFATRYPLFVYFGKTKILAATLIAAGAISVPVTIWLTPRYGAMGAALGYALGYILRLAFGIACGHGLARIEYFSWLSNWRMRRIRGG